MVSSSVPAVARRSNTASANFSNAFGEGNIASAIGASAFGVENNASALNSSAFGFINDAIEYFNLFKSLQAEKKKLDPAFQPLNIACVSIFEGDISLQACRSFIESKLPLIPRYRQRVAVPAFHLGLPVWEYDPEFDIANHVREGLARFDV